MEKTFEFLKTLEKEIQPPLGHHHTIRFGEIGSEEQGWEQVLVLTIVRHNSSQNYILHEASDWERSVRALVTELVALENKARSNG